MTNSLSRTRMVFGQVFMALMVLGLLVFLIPGRIFAQTPPPNQPPVANDDSANTLKNADVIIDVVSNDNDPDGTLNLSSVTPLDTTTGAGGVVHYNGDGTFTYTPALDFIGSDSFDYTICDTATPALCDSATASIEVMTGVSVNVIPKKLNVKKKGVIPVVIRGTEDLDVATIDPETILLEGVPPLRWNVMGRSNRLNLKFRAQDIVDAIEAVYEANNGDEIVLHLTGNLIGNEETEGDAFFGEDTVLIIGVPKHPKK